jgi:hypothetical protein
MVGITDQPKLVGTMLLLIVGVVSMSCDANIISVELKISFGGGLSLIKNSS